MKYKNLRFEIDNNIGRRAKDNKIDTRIKRSTSAGSLRFNKN